MHCEHCIAIALIVITSLRFVVIHTVSIGHKTLSEAQVTHCLNFTNWHHNIFSFSSSLHYTLHCLRPTCAYYLSVLPRSRAHSIFSLLTHCLRRTQVGIIPVFFSSHCLHIIVSADPHTLVSSQCLPRHSYRTHSYRPKPADLKNSIQTWETTTIFSIQWNPNVLGNREELPTQNPPLPLRGILTFKDRRLLIFFKFKAPHILSLYLCISVTVFLYL